jgi:hypothetical protein
MKLRGIMGDEHDEIVEILAELCEENGYVKICAHHVSEGYEPLIVVLPRRGRPLAENFYPDVWAETKRRLIDIYEVWHTESELDAVQDILFSALTKNIQYLHIICTGQNITKERAGDLVDLILSKIHDEKGKHLLHPDYVYVASVPEEMQGNKRAIKRHLRKALGFR